MGRARHDQQQEEFLCHLDSDANEGGHDQEAADPQGQPCGSDHQRRRVYDPSYRGRNRFLANSEYDNDFLLEGWRSLLVRPFSSVDIISSDSPPFSSAVLFAALSSLAEIPTLYAHRPLILRHRKAAMYHPFIEAAAMTLVDIPITLATLTAYSIVLYFVVGLQESAGQFL